MAVTVLAIILLNTYPVTISRDLVFMSKRSSLMPQTLQIGSSVEALERLTPETVGQVMSMLETEGFSRVSVMNSGMDELFSVRNDTRGYDEQVSFNLVRAAIGGETDEFRSKFENGAFKTYSCVPVLFGGEVVGAVCVYEYDATEGSFILDLQDDMARISVALGALSLLIGVILSRTMNRRMTRILDGIRNVREGEYTYRIEVSGHDELRTLAEEFNSLTDRLQKTEETRRRFVADASHELKTPLAAIRLLSDSILETDNIDPETVKEFVGGIREESERLARTTGQLLALTKADNAATVSRVRVDCGQVAENVVLTLKPIARREGVTVNTDIAPDCFIMASSDELFQILYNLVENAIKYNVEGGSVTLTLKSDLKEVRMTVEDTGIGIPEKDLPLVFDRFYRVEKSRGRDQGGTGLGLSIVKTTAQRHGGEVTAQRRAEGGMRFTVTFPACTQPLESGENT